MKTKGINFTRKLHKAFRRYYRNRKMQREKKWDKGADLRHFRDSLPKSVSGFEASAGTFFIYWKSGICTIHNECNYWTGKILARKINGKWVEISKQPH